MDINTKKERKVIYTGKGGYDSDKEKGDKYLIVGNEYTVERVDVHDWSSDVYLKEVQDKFASGARVYFNTVMFRNVEEKESEAEYIDRVRPKLDELLIHKFGEEDSTKEGK